MVAQLRSNQASNSLVEGFQEYFHIQRAQDREVLESIYRIRYGVYCEEFGFDIPHQNGLERDEYDRYSSHCLLSHKKTGKHVGCIRVIALPDAVKSLRLPFIEHCADVLHKDKIQPGAIKPQKVCEISRVAVVSDFRRRPGENTSKDGLASNLKAVKEQDSQHRRFPYIAPCLYLAAGALFLASGREQIYVATEPRLIKSLSLLGIRFTQVSDVANYHGERAVYSITRESISEDLARMPSLLSGLYQYIQSQVT